MKRKLTSRKFWLSVAAFLGSLGTSIAGFATNQQVIAGVGVACAALSAAIYAGCEAAVDAASLSGTVNDDYSSVDAIGFEIENEEMD